MSIRIYPTGEQEYVEDDRRRLIASRGIGNTDEPEVFLQFVDPVADVDEDLGWFAIADIERMCAKMRGKDVR